MIRHGNRIAVTCRECDHSFAVSLLELGFEPVECPKCGHRMTWEQARGEDAEWFDARYEPKPKQR